MCPPQRCCYVRSVRQNTQLVASVVVVAGGTAAYVLMKFYAIDSNEDMAITISAFYYTLVFFSLLSISRKMSTTRGTQNTKQLRIDELVDTLSV